MATKQEFDAAARALLGDADYEKLTAGPSPQNRADLCAYIARQAFVGNLASTDSRALAMIRATARRLWLEDGSLGLD